MQIHLCNVLRTHAYDAMLISSNNQRKMHNDKTQGLKNGEHVSDQEDRESEKKNKR